jgi:hypothetical protein
MVLLLIRGASTSLRQATSIAIQTLCHKKDHTHTSPLLHPKVRCRNTEEASLTFRSCHLEVVQDLLLDQNMVESMLACHSFLIRTPEVPME